MPPFSRLIVALWQLVLFSSFFFNLIIFLFCLCWYLFFFDLHFFTWLLSYLHFFSFYFFLFFPFVVHSQLVVLSYLLSYPIIIFLRTIFFLVLVFQFSGYLLFISICFLSDRRSFLINCAFMCVFISFIFLAIILCYLHFSAHWFSYYKLFYLFTVPSPNCSCVHCYFSLWLSFFADSTFSPWLTPFIWLPFVRSAVSYNFLTLFVGASQLVVLSYLFFNLIILFLLWFTFFSLLILVFQAAVLFMSFKLLCYLCYVIYARWQLPLLLCLFSIWLSLFCWSRYLFFSCNS